MRLRAQPTDARALARLATLWQTQGRIAAAEQAIKLAAALAPAQPQVQQETARYWLAREQLAPALAAWSRLLQGRPQWEATLFPPLLQLAESPAFRPELLRQLPAPLPSWWPRFMAHVAGHTRSLETLEALLQAYRARGPVPTSVQQAVLARLERDAPYAHYYTTWLESLNPVERQRVRYLYDGHFDQPWATVGFGWRVAERPGVVVERFESPPTGGQALRVQFTAVAQPGEIIRQALFLAPGDYRLSGKVQLRGLYSLGGVAWQLRCAEQPNLAPLATGPVWAGDIDWHDFGVEFKLGLECQRPLLQLGLRASRRAQVVPQGEIWIDGLNLRRVGG